MLTIEDLVGRFDAPADRQVKTLVYLLDGNLTLVLLRGDHPLMEQKLADATGTVQMRPAQPDEIREALGGSVLDESGARVPVIMGSYGIGIERAIAAIVECHNDERGIVWPMAVAPFQAAVVVAQPRDSETAAVGERIYQRLRDAGVDVIVDDRVERPGVKFRDVELVGIPLRVTVGRRGVAEGVVELTDRAQTPALPDLPSPIHSPRRWLNQHESSKDPAAPASSSIFWVKYRSNILWSGYCIDISIRIRSLVQRPSPRRSHRSRTSLPSRVFPGRDPTPGRHTPHPRTPSSQTGPPMGRLSLFSESE